MAQNQPKIFQAATSNWAAIPRQAWFIALLSSMVSAGTDLALWESGHQIGLLASTELAIASAIWILAIYLGTSGILKFLPTVKGYGLFLIGSIVLLLPLGATFLLLIFEGSLFSQSIRIGILLLGLCGGFLILSLLPAWPTAQGLSKRAISPWRVLKSTRGHRWSLIIFSFAIGSINNSKIIPSISKADNTGEAILICVGNIGLALVTFGFVTGCAAAALQFSARNDPQLLN